MNCELISLIKWYIFDESNIQTKILNLKKEQLEKERLSFIFLDYLTKNNLPNNNIIESCKNSWSVEYNYFYKFAKWYTKFAASHKLTFSFIKGFSLSIKNYNDCLHRPFSDIDILIQEEDAEEFKKEMLNANFKLVEIKEKSILYEYLGDNKAIFFDINFDKNSLFDKNMEFMDDMPVLSDEKHFIYLVLSLPNIIYSQDNIFDDIDVFPLYKVTDMLLLLRGSDLNIILEESKKIGCLKKIQCILSSFDKAFGTKYI